MLTADELRGMWAGLPVSWTVQDTFDEGRFRDNLRRCCRAGVHGVYSHGTTGEFYAQSFEEWQAVASAMVEECRAAGTPCQIGVTDLYTKGVIRKAQLAAEIGADALQLALPFWLPMTLQEAVQFFVDVADAVPGTPLVLYGTARAKTLTTIELMRAVLDAGVPLIGCKYAGSAEALPAFVEQVPEVSFLVGESLLATGMAVGARGSCTAYVYVCPRYMLRYFSLCEEARWDEALAIEQHVKDWHAGACAHLFEKKLQDSALDRVFAHAAGFIDIEIRCRPPYRSATEEDVRIYVEACERDFPEFIHDIA